MTTYRKKLVERLNVTHGLMHTKQLEGAILRFPDRIVVVGSWILYQQVFKTHPDAVFETWTEATSRPLYRGGTVNPGRKYGVVNRGAVYDVTISG